MAQKNELTGKPGLMKELNISLIMDALKTCHSATRVELSSMTGISQPTVNLLIRQLLAQKEVVSLGMAESTGGRKAELFSLNHRRSFLAAILVRETGFEYIVSDLSLAEEAHGMFSREENSSYSHQLCRLISGLIGQNPDIAAVSIGVPGAVSEAGVVFAIPQIPEWESFGLAEYIRQKFPVTVTVMNDINATVTGYFDLTGEKTQNLVYLHMEGVGLGAGILIDGHLYPGFQSFAGEVGSMRIDSQKSLEELLRHADAAERTALLTKVAVNIICILNPAEIILGGSGVSPGLTEALYMGCLSYLPGTVLPKFKEITDFTDCYFRGLCRQGLALLDSGIHLV